MHFQFDMAAASFRSSPNTTPSSSEVPDLLRQLLEVQREQLGQIRLLLGYHDGGARWRAFAARWQDDFPDLPEACRQAMPVLERCYGKLIAELTENLSQSGVDSLDNDFALQDFLDRFGVRLTQLGTLLNMVGPLAEAGTQSSQT